MILGGLKNDASRIILHVDFDYFFAQCEEIRRPELRNKPVVVCVYSGRTDDSGVVSTANYIARKYDVKSGLPIKVAKSKLAEVSDAQFVPVDSEFYSRVSESAMFVISSYADKFERASIDECYLDVSDRVGSIEAAKAFARDIKNDLKKHEQLTCSIGVAPNKMLGKLASDLVKPDGLSVIDPENAAVFIAKMDVTRITGIGPKTSKRLEELGVKTLGDLAKFDLYRLIKEFGKKNAIYIYNASRGIDDDPVRSREKQQIMRIATLKRDATSSMEMAQDLYNICSSVFKIANDRKSLFRTVAVLLILDNLENITRSKSLKVHSNSFESMHSVARSILEDAMNEAGRTIRVRRLGIRLSDLRSSKGQNTILDFISGERENPPNT